MGASLIFGVVVFGFVIFILTGLGILTKAIYGISEGTTYSTVAGTQSPDTVAFIKNKTIDEKYTKAMQDADLIAIPTSAESVVASGSGQYIINLSGTDLTVAKIALITFWILIIIGVIGFKFLF